MPPTLPQRVGVVRSPTITSGKSPLSWHVVSQHELAVPFELPSSHASPDSTRPLPQTASAPRAVSAEARARKEEGGRVSCSVFPARRYDTTRAMGTETCRSGAEDVLDPLEETAPGRVDAVERGELLVQLALLRRQPLR